MKSSGSISSGAELILPGLLLAAAIVGLLLHSLTVRSNLLLAGAAFSPYLMLGAPISLIYLLFRRHWLVVAAGGVVLICVLLEAPLFVSQRAPVGGLALNVMTVNLRRGAADPDAVVRLVRERHIDLLTTQELTDAEVDRLTGAGLSALLPHSSVDARERAAGVGVWSRYPLTTLPPLTGYLYAVVSVEVHISQQFAPLTVLATHMPGPWPQASTDWLADIARFSVALRTLRRGNPGGAVLVGGDFNATTDTAQFRRLLSNGYRDAAEQSGSGYTATYPGNSWYGPLLAIDHVLTRNAVATSARTATVDGSDHRALVVRVVISGR